MNKFTITINNIQPIQQCVFDIPLSNTIICITGKNGLGKTVLVKSIANLVLKNIFTERVSRNIISETSRITYSIDGTDYISAYDDKIKCLEIYQRPDVNDVLDVELALPYGERFTHFQDVSARDKNIRAKRIMNQFSKPESLIDFLTKIYPNKSFESLREIKDRKDYFYIYPLVNNKYIREDFFSSGEYFLISIFRKLQRKRKLIVIDEIDISLDAEAQTNLIRYLREFCVNNSCTVIFTSHSLALMKTLKKDELYLMSSTHGITQIMPESYNYVKSTLFGFQGWDKYLLVEDTRSQGFLEFLLGHKNFQTRVQYKIIPIGAANSLVKLVERNKNENFLSKEENILSILDGDKKDEHADAEYTIFYPVADLEKYMYQRYLDGNLQINFTFVTDAPRFGGKSKDFFAQLLHKEYDDIVTNIYLDIYSWEKNNFDLFSNQITTFIGN